MFRKILYPTDFSENAEKALEYIKKLKEAGTEEVVILHVIDTAYLEAYEDVYSLEGMNTEQMMKKLKEEKEKKMGEIEEKLHSYGLKTKTSIRMGKPYEEIVKAAAEEKVSIIVLGSTGKGAISEAIERLLGSTVENVVAHAKTPVLVVR